MAVTDFGTDHAQDEPQHRPTRSDARSRAFTMPKSAAGDYEPAVLIESLSCGWQRPLGQSQRSVVVTAHIPSAKRLRHALMRPSDLTTHPTVR